MASSDAPPLSPVALAVLNPPIPVAGSDNMIHLTFEVLITNFTKTSLIVQRVDLVNAGQTGRTLASYPRDVIGANMALVGDWTRPTNTLVPSQQASFFVDATVGPGQSVPDALTATVAVAAAGDDKDAAGAIAATVLDTSIRVPVNRSTVHVLSPPLVGDRWLAAEGCCAISNHHRRGMRSVAGHLVIPERYAIDFLQLDANGDLHTGEDKIANYFGYGKPVLAVADATVIDVWEGNDRDLEIGQPLANPVLPDAGGNHVILDLGDGTYAMYGHLKPGSIKVKNGDRVRNGQTIAAVGNNGATTGPHLHFQLMDNTSFALAEGVPYEFDSFVLVGHVNQKTGQQLLKAPEPHTKELPLTLTIVNFRDRS